MQIWRSSEYLKLFSCLKRPDHIPYYQYSNDSISKPAAGTAGIITTKTEMEGQENIELGWKIL